MGAGGGATEGRVRPLRIVRSRAVSHSFLSLAVRAMNCGVKKVEKWVEMGGMSGKWVDVGEKWMEIG